MHWQTEIFATILTNDIQLDKWNVLEVRMSDKVFPFHAAPTYRRTKSSARD